MKRRISRSLAAAGVMACGAALGCSGTPAPTTSTITGTIQQQSFATPVTKITVHTDTGDTTVGVEASGQFRLTLQKGHEYRFLLSDDGKSMPLMLRSAAGRYDTTVIVKTGGATVDLGAVTHWAGSGGAAALVSAPPVATQEAPASCTEEDGEEDDDHECVDGIDPTNGEYCDGGPAANAEAPDAVEDTDCEAGDEMALGQYNLPNELSCGDDDEEVDDD